MHAVWPKVTDPDNRVAAALNGLPKHVVSTTLADPTWQHATVISTDVLDAVSALKDGSGRELQVTAAGASHASCTTRDWSTNSGCWVFPVVVGSGKRLFSSGSAASGFNLVDSEETSAGVTYHALRPTAFTTGTVEPDELASRPRSDGDPNGEDAFGQLLVLRKEPEFG